MAQIDFNNLPQAVSEIQKKLEKIEFLLREKPNKTEPQEERFLTIQQAGKLLNLSVATLYGYVQRSQIPVCKRGKRLFFSQQELLNWVKAGRKKTSLENIQEVENYLLEKGMGGRAK